MEVVYKENISDKIIKVIHQRYKPIEYIKLTPEEAVELYNFNQEKLVYGSLLKSAKECMCERIHNSVYYGVLLKVSGY